MLMRKWLYILAFMLLPGFGHATHIVGGEMYYNQLSRDSFEIVLLYYVDCENGSPVAISQDAFASFTVFADSQAIAQHFVRRNQPIRLNAVNYTCIIPNGNVCVHMYRYDTVLYLPPRPGGYTVAYQRCCRNHSILNLVDPGATGSTYSCHISGDSTFTNHSPRFNNLPPNYLCNNEPFRFDHSATDPDGDSLYYRLRTPYSGATSIQPRPDTASKPPWMPVRWANPYHDRSPLPTDSIWLDSLTGDFEFTPNRLGQYVFGVVVEEYRDRKRIGQNLRDYQFNIMPCRMGIDADFAMPSTICDTSSIITAENRSIGASAFHWIIQSSTGIDTFKGTALQYRFAERDTYNITLVAIAGNCTDSLTQELLVLGPSPQIHARKLASCPGAEIVVKAAQYEDATYSWKLNDLPFDPINNRQIRVWPDSTTVYVAEIAFHGCTVVDSTIVHVPEWQTAISADSLLCKTKATLYNHSTKSGNFEWLIEPDVPMQSYSPDSVVLSLPNEAKRYVVIMLAEHQGCRDTAELLLDYLPEQTLQVIDTQLCEGASFRLPLTQIRGAHYEWEGAGNVTLTDNQELSGMANNSFSGVMTMRYKQCSYADSVHLQVWKPQAQIAATWDTLCDKTQLTLENRGTADSAFWWKNNSFSAQADVITHTLREPEKAQWRLVAQQGSCTDTTVFSYNYSASTDYTIEMPNVFSPNGDGINDCFGPVGKATRLCEPTQLVVYNRWGEKLYESTESTDFPCWDGRNARGQAVLTGTYFYFLQVGSERWHSTVTLLH